MLQFRAITMEDRQMFEQLSAGKQILACEYHFAHLFLWKDADEIQIARDGSDLFFKEHRVGCYLVPMGQDPVLAMEKLVSHCKERGEKLVVYSGYQEFVEKLSADDRFMIRHERNYDDYLYAASDLILLPGKKYHGKRGHIAKFLREHEAVYAPYSPSDLEECLLLEEAWMMEKGAGEAECAEAGAIKNALEYGEVLGLSGGVLRVGGKIVAFTVGQRVNNTLGIVHFEKCLPGFEGAYPVIHQQFAAHTFSDLLYINRQDDMGLPGLRRAKESYHPIRMIQKYKITLREEEED